MNEKSPDGTAGSENEKVLRGIPVLIVDAKEPFPELALYRLDVVPRAGDFILVGVSGQLRNYRVEFVNINPFQQKSHVSVGCSFVDGNSTITNSSNDMKERMDKVIQMNTQVFDKALAYSTAIKAVGYAGILALWAMSRDVQPPKSTNLVIILVAMSLTIYVCWEIVGMVTRAHSAAKFVSIINKNPEDFFQILKSYEADQVKTSARLHSIWRYVLYPTIVTALLAVIVMIYNSAASLFGFAHWPQ